MNKCEICEKPATREAADLIGLPPDTEGWISATLGKIHYGCAEHEPPAKEYPYEDDHS